MVFLKYRKGGVENKRFIDGFPYIVASVLSSFIYLASENGT